MEISMIEGGRAVHFLSYTRQKGLIWWKKLLIKSNIIAVGKHEQSRLRDFCSSLHR